MNYPPIDDGNRNAYDHLQWLKACVDQFNALCYAVSIYFKKDTETDAFVIGYPDSTAMQIVAQDPESMRVEMNVGACFIDDLPYHVSAVQTSPEFAVPISDLRIDTVALNSANGLMSIHTGEEDSSPVAPDVDEGEILLAWVHHRTTETAIYDSDVSPHADGYIEDKREVIL